MPKSRIFVYLILILFYSFFNQISAQEEQSGIPLIDNVSVPSPNAAEIMKHGEVDVNLSNGLPSLMVPIHTIKEGDITLPIYLTHHTGGVKVNELSTWVGQNWSLIAGGQITRSVKGLPDETLHGIRTQANTNSLETANLITSVKAQFGYPVVGPIDIPDYALLEGIDAIDQPGDNNPSIQDDFVYALTQGKRDTESDLYSFNFNGYSGKFYFDVYGDLKLQSSQNIELMPVESSSEAGLVTKWEVKTPDGFYYEFGQSSHETMARELSYMGDPDFPIPYYQTWHLTKITSPYGNELLFFYEQYNQTIDRLYSITMYHDLALANGTLPSVVQSQMEYIQGRHLDRIEWSSGKFEISELTTLPDGGKQIDEITIFDSENEENVRFELEYDSSMDRRWLKTVQEFAGNNSKPPYIFDYHNRSSVSPLNGYNQDHWGYQNSNPKLSLVPSFAPYTVNEIPFGEADRSTDPIKQLDGAISKVTYPTGGYTEFDFESNDYSFLTEDNGFSAVLIPTINQNYTHVYNNYDLEYQSGYGYTESQTFQTNKTHYARLTFDIFNTANPTICEAEFLIKDDLGNIIVQKTFPDILIGDWEAIEIEANKLYTIETKTYWTGDVVAVDLEYLNDGPILEKNFCGGIRVKEIRSYDGISTEPALKRKFKYEEDSGISYGVLLSEPNYFFNYGRETWITCDTYLGQVVSLNYLESQWKTAKTSPLNNIYSYNGNHLIYKNVIELFENSTERGKIVYSYTNPTSNPEFYSRVNPSPPFAPPLEQTHKFGKLLSQKVYDVDNNIRNEEIYEYENFEYDDPSGIDDERSEFAVAMIDNGFVCACGATDIICDKSIDVRVMIYARQSGLFRPISKTTRSYEDNGIFETIESYDYLNDNHLNSNIVSTNLSKSEEVKIHTYFPNDFDANLTEIQDLAEVYNLDNTPLFKVTEVGGNVIAATLANYQIDSHGNPVIESYHDLDVDQIIAAQAFIDEVLLNGTHPNFRKVMNYHAFNESGKLLEYQVEDGTYNSVTYDDSDYLPIAICVNCKASDHLFRSFEKNENENFIGTLEDVTTFRSGEQSSRIIPGENLSTSFTPAEQEETFIAEIWYRTDAGFGNDLLQATLSTHYTDLTQVEPTDASGYNTVQSTHNIAYNDWLKFELEIDLGAIRENSAAITPSDNLQIQLHLSNLETGANVYIDDIRIFPKNAQMSNYIYNEKQEVVSVIGANTQSAFFEYDGFSRLKLARDHFKDITEHHEYHYKDGVNDKNYVKSIGMKTAISQESQIANLTVANKVVSINYSDDLGRVIQSVTQNGSPMKKDLVQYVAYDEFGRVEKEYLPFASANDEDGSFKEDALTKQEDFYLTASRVAHTDNAFSEVKYEESPLSRVEEKASPGEQWNLADGEVQATNVLLNESDEIIQWAVGVSGELICEGFYFGAELAGNEIIDENGHATRTYSDKRGQLIVSRKQLGTEWLDTYNVYDDIGNLIKMIQPEGIIEFDVLGQSSFPVSISPSSSINDFIFTYEYDERQRMIRKKIPGADWIDYFYNRLDQVVLTQDGNQRPLDEYSFTKYDALGRTIMTGICVPTRANNTSLTRPEIESLISGWLWETRDEDNYADNFGYTDHAFPTAALSDQKTVLTVNYYDDYDFDFDGTEDIAYQSNTYNPIYSTDLGDDPGLTPLALNNEESERTRGFTTRTQSRILNGPNEGNWIKNTLFYDEYGREIQIQNQNYINGQNVIDNYYNFAGELRHVNVKHIGDPNGDGVTEVNIKSRNHYDHAGRLLESYSQVNEERPVLMIRNNYNEIGQLIEKNIGSQVLGSYLQSIDYSYNPRGWLTHINNCDLSNDNILPEYEDSDYKNNAIIVDDIKFKFMERDDNGLMRIALEISDTRDLELEDQSTGATREVSANERWVDYMVSDEGAEATLYSKMSPLVDDSLYMFTDNFVFPTGASTIGLYNAAEALMLNELSAKNISDSDVIDALKTQLMSYIQLKFNNVFYNDDDDDLWGMCIQYNTTSGEFDNSALYNGNISEIHWKNKFDEKKRGYGFQYDDLERMKQAQYKANYAGTWAEEVNNYDEFGINYDGNGNITSLMRTGLNQINAFGLIDDLTYSYSGNQLLAVNDAVETSPQNMNGYGDFDFTDGTEEPIEYIYDANGNMTEDKNKGITSITYNHLNLPEVITIDGGKTIEFIYDANGIKQHKITNDGSNPLVHSYYDGNFHYGEDDLSFITTSEGRVVPETDAGGRIMHRYEYHYSDHQNNLRLAYCDLNYDFKIDPLTEILQIGDYYPFGMEHQGHANPQWEQIGAEHQYTFQGQLKHEDFGLNWSQFKWRNHMPDLGRFFNVDPLSEQYSHNSTYAFAENMLIHAIELEGLEARIAIHGKGQIGKTGYTQSHINAFESRALSLTDNQYTTAEISSGKGLISTLTDATSSEGHVESAVIFSHGGEDGLYLNASEGFYKDDRSSANSASVGDLLNAMSNGDIQFGDDASIVFGSCNACFGGIAYTPIAEELTSKTGVTTIAASGIVEPEIINGKETGNLTTDGTFYKNEIVYDFTVLNQNGEVINTGTANSLGAFDSLNLIPNDLNGVNATISVKTRMQKTDLGNTIDPTQY